MCKILDNKLFWRMYIEDEFLYGLNVVLHFATTCVLGLYGHGVINVAWYTGFVNNCVNVFTEFP